MSVTLQSSLGVVLNFTYSKTNPGTQPTQAKDNVTNTANLGTNVANNAVNGSDTLYGPTIVNLAAGASTVVALTGTLVDLIGDTNLNFARIKGILVELLAANQNLADGTVGTACASITVGGNVLAPPSGFAVGAATNGGALTAGTYYYKITGINANGETLPSAEASGTTASTNLTLPLSWTQLTGATGYRIYRGTSAGNENVLIATISSGSTVSYNDAGGQTSISISPPTVSTAANKTALAGASGLFTQSFSGVRVFNGGFAALAAGNAGGVTVTAGTSDQLKINNEDGTNAAVVRLTVIGGST